MKLSRHARSNMRLYKISEMDILNTIKSPEGSTKEEERLIAMRKFPGKFSGYPLKVVYQKSDDEPFIITVYPLKKETWR
jgi:hypothetical protein